MLPPPNARPSMRSTIDINAEFVEKVKAEASLDGRGWTVELLFLAAEAIEARVAKRAAAA